MPHAQPDGPLAIPSTGKSQAVIGFSLGAYFALDMDEFEPQAEVDSLEESLSRAGRPVTFYRYRGTGHWFFEPDRSQAYNPAAASLAWDRTLAFLRRSSNL